MLLDIRECINEWRPLRTPSSLDGCTPMSIHRTALYDGRLTAAEAVLTQVEVP